MTGTADSESPGGTWSFATARVPAEFPAVEVEGVPGGEHAGGAGHTLCGIRGRYPKSFLHRFQPQAPASCRTCRALAAAAPSRPCGQERLHDLLLQEADDGPLRTDLLAALRRGARIATWTTGPAKSLTRFDAHLDEMTEEAVPAAEALAAAGEDSVTLARVEDADRQYLVVLPPAPRSHRARGGDRVSRGSARRAGARPVGPIGSAALTHVRRRWGKSLDTALTGSRPARDAERHRELAARWWKWAFSAPAGHSPVQDETGANAAWRQPGDVWFLAGTFGGRAERRCSVPAGRPLFFPVFTYEVTALQAPLGAPRMPLAVAKASLNGSPLPLHEVSARWYWSRGLPRSTWGQWCSIEPLRPGEYVLWFKSATTGGFRVEVTYHLEVSDAPAGGA